MMKSEDVKKLKQIQITQQEIWDAMKPNVYRNKKKYTRKKKHPRKDLDA